MNIANYQDAIKNCRFCFMCRHLSGVANVTFREADTPRVRAASLYSILNDPAKLNCADFIQTTYDSDLSAACRYHCVSHYDENGLTLAARADIVAAGLAPEAVKKIADDFEATAKWTVSGEGDVLYFLDKCSAETPAIAKSFAKLMAAKGVAYRTVKGGCIGKVLRVLGFIERSKKAAAKFAKYINDLGAKTLVVSNPAAYEMLTAGFAEYGIKLKPKVMHSSEYIAGLKLAYDAKKFEAYYLESDFLRNYCDNYAGPEKLLKELKVTLKPFGTNNEESYSAGEGAVVLPLLNEKLAIQLAEHVAARADDPKKDLIVTASPYTRQMLAKYGKLKVVTLEELAAERLKK